MSYDVTIVGAGHNGLVTAAYLAKAGLKTIVLERRSVVGGGAVTEEIHPGFRCSTLDHSAGPLSPQVIADLGLTKHSLELFTPAARVVTIDEHGNHLCIFNDTQRTVHEIEKFSSKDAKQYPEFVSSFARIGKVLAPILSLTPPSIDKPAKSDLWHLGKIGLAFRGLGKKDEYRLLRWGPMAVADLAAEWFDTELLRAVVAARGISGAFAGPWSAGTSLGLLWQAATDGGAIGPTSFAKGGLGAITQALANAAKSFGAEVRTQSEAKSIEPGKVVLTSGEVIESKVVVSNADPKTTFLSLVDPIELDPGFLLKMRNYRAPGTTAKINLALSRLPEFRGVDTDKLSGRIQIGPEIDYLERAFDASKYGDFSEAPYLDVTIPSLTDDSLTTNGKHVVSIHVQFAPYKLRNGDWTSRREEFADKVIDHLSKFASGVKESIVARQIITPIDLESEYGLSGGHIHHGEQTLDQVFAFRPLIGWARYRTPIPRLYLCGAGTHPGGGITGVPGANAAREILKDFKKKV